MVASLIGVGPGKGGRLDRGKLQFRNQGDDVLIRSTQGAQAEHVGAIVLSTV